MEPLDRKKGDEELRQLAAKNAMQYKVKKAERHATKVEAERKLNWSSVVGKGQARRIMLVKNCNFRTDSETPTKTLQLLCEHYLPKTIQIEKISQLSEKFFTVKFNREEGLLHMVEIMDGILASQLYPQVKFLDDDVVSATSYGNEDFDIFKLGKNHEEVEETESEDEKQPDWLDYSSDSEIELKYE